MTHADPSFSVAVFASGSGTNAENLAKYFAAHAGIRVRLIVSNKADAYVLQRAANLQVPAVVIPAHDWKEPQKVLDVLGHYGIDFIILAGYLRLLPPWLVEAYPQKIINIHPALLPSYGGKGMYGEHVHRAVIAAGEKKSGITIHYVNARYDEGDIIFQASCPVFPEDTPETLAARIHALEYEHFPRVAEKVMMQHT